MKSAFAILALLPSAFAAVFITAPVGSTSWPAGQKQTISWQDNGQGYKLADFGSAKVGIYAGNAQQQTQLQAISDNVNMATTSSIEFTPDAGIGPDSNEYFVRIESLTMKDPGAPQFPALAFSAKFAMTGMKGTFAPAVQAQIDGQSSAPLAGASSAAPAGSSSSAAASSTSKPASSSSASASKTGSTTASATGAAASNAAGSLSGPVFPAMIAAVAAFMFL
jgi:hypothetical protein